MSEKNNQNERGLEATGRAEKKPEKKSEKPSLPIRVRRWFREMQVELKKVVWPTRKQLVNNTIIVVVAVVIVSAAIGVLDYLFLRILNLLRETF
ncbi:MAG: preprotein translocase subunit SecE [Oscillospiraceae bacterium]|nr:preprotein translocase subunit SecE [Oscillospiraceae bacterium]